MTRDAASETLVALRAAMGKTQAQFAVEILRTAVTTIARWETHSPPRGEILQRLRQIARDNKLSQIVGKFDALINQEKLESANAPLTYRLPPESDSAQGEFLIALPNESAIIGAQGFLLLVAQLRSPHEEVRKHAAAALESLRDAARKYDRLGVEIQEAALPKSSAIDQSLTKKGKKQ